VSVQQWRSEFRIEHGRDPTHLEARAWSVTQRVKKGIWHRGQLDDAWAEIAAYYGFTPQSVEALRTGAHSPADDPAQARAQLIDELPGENGLTQRESAFTLRMLRVRAYEWSAGLLDAPEVEQVIDAVQRHDEVVQLNEELWTTQEMLDLEREVIQWKADRGRKARHPQPARRQVAEALIRAPVPLSAEQHGALTAMRGGQTTCVTGQAGTGKGVVLGVAADVWHRQDRRVFALALGGRQAQQLGSDLGKHATPLTIDAFTLRVKLGRIQLRDSDVITIDEAGQVGTRQWVRLTRAIGQAPQVVALGDAAQLAPLAVGGVWPSLSAGGPQLRGVFRTKLAWEKTAWTHLRIGEADEALRLYARHGHLRLLENRYAATEAAVDAWDADGRTGLLITDSSNRELSHINRMAQARKKTAGELGETSVSVETRNGTSPCTAAIASSSTGSGGPLGRPGWKTAPRRTS
jgi:ATP-dependent exoDNAse (exonuclease V) alpha subunit